MTLSPQWLDELRSRITLSTLIGRHVKVQRAGREYKACCPFHNEKTPSFTINDDKGFYHCFGCGAHGDAIRFMTDHQGLGFMDAVKELAAEAGMSVPAPDPRAARQAEARATLHDVCQAAQDWFVAQLGSAAGEEARAYLKNRGLTAETIARFGIGFAPDSRTGIKSALGHLDEELLIQAEPPYDRFRGRIMIPIRDPRGRVIAFGGRILGAGEPKYLNSPDTPLFDKGRTLYNLHLAAPASRQSGRVVVVEGYMDVIALAQAGFGECVAPLGTALTEHQIERLWKMVDRPLLCFDGDNAGQKAAMRAATRALPLLRPGLSLGFVSLPGGQDPDDLVRASGPQAFAACLDQATGLLDHLWSHELNAQPLASPEARAGFKARLNAHADTIADGDIKALYRREIGQRFSDLFFAARAPSPARAPQQRGGTGGKTWQRRDEPVPPSEDARTFSRLVEGNIKYRSILLGLLQRPHAIRVHSEALTEAIELFGTWSDLLTSMLDAADLDHDRTLDTDALIAILHAHGHTEKLTVLTSLDRPDLAFCRPVGSDAETERRIAELLSQAIDVLVTRPKLVAALAEVSRLYEIEFDDALFLEQQRLSDRIRAIDRREMDLLDKH